VPPAIGPISGAILTRAIVARPYTLTLAIGPPDTLYSPAQARTQHPKGGEIVLGGATPAGVARSGAPAPHRSLALYVSSATTGKTIIYVAVAITIASAEGTILQRVPVELLQPTVKGPVDRHFGNNVALLAGHYLVLAHVGQVSATFDVPLRK
jgi:hypothetical protein